MSTERDAAITAYEELSDMLSVLRAATKSASPPSADAISTIAELSLKRASCIGSFLADLPHD